MTSSNYNDDYDDIVEDSYETETQIPQIDEFEFESGMTLEMISRFRRDTLEKLGFDPANMSMEETRFVVTSYYSMQKPRIQVSNRLSSLEKAGDPGSMLKFTLNGLKTTEENIQKILTAFSAGQPIGTWAESFPGIGPIISAGLIANIDISKAQTAGSIWRFAGYDSTNEWLGTEKARTLVNEYVPQRSVQTEVTDEKLAEIATRVNRKADALRAQALSFQKDVKPGMENVVTKGQLVKALAKRPWNASLKQVCFHLGESFVKIAGKTTKKGPDVYGKMYADRKVLEIQRNENGDFADQAYAKANQVGRSTDAYKSYSIGKLPPGHIHARSKRYAVKMFLSHYHHVLHEMTYNTPPPKPFVIEHGGHAHYIKPPHWNGKSVECDCN